MLAVFLIISTVYIAIVLSIFTIAFSIISILLSKQKRKDIVHSKQLGKLQGEINEDNTKLLKVNHEMELQREELLTQTEHLKDLNQELERLSLVASKTDTSVAIANVKGEFLWVNKGFEELFGYTLDEYKKEVGINIHTTSTKKGFSKLLDKAYSNKESLNYTSKVISKDGSIKWVKTVLNPIFDTSSNFKQFIVLDTDITKLKNANNELKKLSLVASKSSNSVAIYDSNGGLDWINDGFVALNEMSLVEFKSAHGNHIEDYFAMNNKGNLLFKLHDSKKEVRFISSFENREGKTTWKQVIVTPVYDSELDNYVVVESNITKIKDAEHAIQVEKDKTDQLLLNILPEETAEELKSKGSATPRFYRTVSVLFADIQDFTKLAEDMTPQQLVEALQLYFSHFDDAVSSYFVEKIKTMGDAFLCVGGIPMRNKSHPFDTVLVGLELQRIMKRLAPKREEQGMLAWQLRIGIHSGSVIAGVVGKQKMTYDIWGDSVNIAKRIESACLPGMVNVSAATYEVIKDYFECEHRGKILAKHKGHIDMYFVHRIKSEFSENGEGIIPNHFFKEMLAQL